MLFITGDTHGDMSRFTAKAFRKSGLKPPKKGDTLLVCGDFGFVWDGSREEQKRLVKLGRKKYQILFVAGTHENFELLGQYPITEFAGGMARTISGKLRCLENGYPFTLEGMHIFACGGGESDDALIRMELNCHDPRELPDLQTVRDAGNRFVNFEEKFDVIVTHDGPTRMRNFINLENGEMNILHALFDKMQESDKFDRWFFGRYHIDRRLSGKFTVVYQKILPLNTRKKRARREKNPKTPKQ